MILAAALLAAGCGSPVASEGPAPASVLGTWSFTAVQLGPARADLTGTLVVTRQAGPEFDGRVEAMEIDAEGRARRLGGVVTGRVLAGGTVDFDAFLGPGARRHLATLAGDSMSGSWVESSGLGLASGSFAARRVR